jgi:hypothetical protein
MPSRKQSRRGSKRLNPALKEMSQIVKKLSKCGIKGPKLMKEAAKVYHGKKTVTSVCKTSRKGSRKTSRRGSRKGSRK